MCGRPQTLVSKFKISFNLLLNLIDIGDKNAIEFAKRSMIQDDINRELGTMYKKIAETSAELEKIEATINHLKTPRNVLVEHLNLKNNLPKSTNKRRKEIERRLLQIKAENFNVEKDAIYAEKYYTKEKELSMAEEQFKSTEEFLNRNVQLTYDFLKTGGFIEETNLGENDVKLTQKGGIASQIRELHCLVFASVIEDKKLSALSARQLVGVFSCFTNVSTSEDLKALVPYSEDKKVQNTVIELNKMYDSYLMREDDNGLNSGTDYNRHFDLIDYVMAWTDAEDVVACKLVLQKLEKEKEIFLGEFVKALLKINNISSEMEKIAESLGDIDFLSKLREIPVMTLKFVATNQSLYI
jgi:superfamily II RNA helicase